MTENIDIKGIDKAELLAGLYNAAGSLGLGFLHIDSDDMTIGQAREIINNSRSMYFDYINGRVLKINLEEDVLNCRNYDRDNGVGTAAKVVESVRNGMPVQHKPPKELIEALDGFLERTPQAPEEIEGFTVVATTISPEARQALEEVRRKFNDSPAP